MTTPAIPTTVPQSSSGGATDQQIAQLAAQLNKPALSFDPSTIRKGNVTAIDLGDDSTAPTVTVLLSGDETSPIAGVRLAADYSPQVGDMVLLLKQGSEFFAAFSIAKTGSAASASSDAGGWTKATLGGSNTHNGNSNGDLMYRRVMEDGCWKMQWKGAIGYSSSTVLSSPLIDEFRPSARASLINRRDSGTGGGVAIGIDFNTDGTVSIVAPAWTTNSDTHSHTISGSASVGGSTSGHSHSSSLGDAIGVSSDGVSASGSIAGSANSDAHSHTSSNPTYVSFGGLEYFL